MKKLNLKTECLLSESSTQYVLSSEGFWSAEQASTQLDDQIKKIVNFKIELTIVFQFKQQCVSELCVTIFFHRADSIFIIRTNKLILFVFWSIQRLCRSISIWDRFNKMKVLISYFINFFNKCSLVKKINLFYSKR